MLLEDLQIEVFKVSPQSGDIIILSCDDFDRLHRIRHSLFESFRDILPPGCFVLLKSSGINIDNIPRAVLEGVLKDKIAEELLDVVDLLKQTSLFLEADDKTKALDNIDDAKQILQELIDGSSE